MTHTPYEIIRKKRDGNALSEEEIDYLVSEYDADRLPDYQMSAFLMAVVFRGMTDRETLYLTRAMIASGKTVDLSDTEGFKVDKHSTGGVGDKISLLLAPLVAACGVKVPMVSGRGLGHTGGTIDKLESIPGFRTNLSTDEYKSILGEVGLVMSAPTVNLAPADRKMYALRDVTSTVESIPLITSSIMSKKLAEGIDALVLDVKFGSGAFMESILQARNLAKKMVAIGKMYGKKTVAYLTDMNQPLGHEVGNWLEVAESIRILRNEADVPDVRNLTLELAAEMISLSTGESTSRSMTKAKEALSSGAAYRRFLEMVRAQGGDRDYIEDVSKYPAAGIHKEVLAVRSGYVKSIDTRTVGMAAVKLGAGRMELGDAIDPTAGITVIKKIGAKVSRNDVLALLHSNNRDMIEATAGEVLAAYKLTSSKPSVPQLIKERIA